MIELWHVTFVEKGVQAVLRPKIPENSAPGENVTVDRISLAPSITECVRGIGNEVDFKTDFRKIYAYKIIVGENDNNLYNCEYLYNNDLVYDALLTHEYWYTKPIVPQEVLICEVRSVEEKKYIIIGSKLANKLKDILLEIDYTETIPMKISPFEIVNYVLNESTVEMVKARLRHKVIDYTEEDEAYEICRKLWGNGPRMFHYENDYYETEYIKECEIKIIMKCNKLFRFEEIYSRKRLEEICSSDQFMLATWKLVDEKYIGTDSCHLCVITDETCIPIGLLYYSLYNEQIHIMGFEVIKPMRGLGLGTTIIKQFLNEHKICPKDIWLEPLSEEAEKFWKKLGVPCSL